MLGAGLCLLACDAATNATDTPVLDDAETEVDLEVISDPGCEAMTQTAPDEFKVLFHTTAGDFVVQVTRDWAPIGADRFYNLVVNGFYNETRFFRVAAGRGGGRFVVQWGIHGEPEVNTAWRASDDANIDDDPVTQSNTRGRLTFATSGPNSRTTQLFISYGDNSFLDDMGFSVFGEVVGDGMESVDAITDEYGERAQQHRIQREGNEYLESAFPNMDYIISTTIVEDEDDSDE